MGKMIPRGDGFDAQLLVEMAVDELERFPDLRKTGHSVPPLFSAAAASSI
jgi:hypothetical protein